MRELTINSRSQVALPRSRRFPPAVAAFVLPVLIYGAYYAIMGIFPFGPMEMTTVDLRAQYIPFLVEFRNKILSGGSLFFTWNGALGSNFFTTWAYYLVSPLNLLVLLFPVRHMAACAFLIILIKIGLAGYCFQRMLSRVFQRQDPISAAFAVCYALSNFVIVYAWNLMWMDALIMLPLVMESLVFWIRESRPLPYLAVLTAAIILNYYTAYFICLFAAQFTWIAVAQFSDAPVKEKLLLVFRTFLLSLAAVCLSAFILLPAVMGVSESYVHFAALTGSRNVFYGNIPDTLSQPQIIQRPYVFYGSPNVYCGLAGLLLFPVFILKPALKRSVRIGWTVLMFFIFFSFVFRPLDLLWNGFHQPTGMEYRYAFLFVFVLLTAAWQGLPAAAEMTTGRFLLLSSATAVLSILPAVLYGTAVDWTRIPVTLVFIAGYIFFLKRKKSGSVSWKQPILWIMIFEMILNFTVTATQLHRNHPLTPRDQFLSEPGFMDRQQLCDLAAEEKGHRHFRLFTFDKLNDNDLKLLNCGGVSVFDSNVRTETVKGLGRLGYSVNDYDNAITSPHAGVVMNTILGMDYFIAPDTWSINAPEIRQIAAAGSETLYALENLLPFGFFIKDKAALHGDSVSTAKSPFAGQNHLVADYLDGKSVFRNAPPILDEVSLTNAIELTPKPDGEYSFKKTDDKNTFMLNYTFPENGRFLLSWSGDIRIMSVEEESGGSKTGSDSKNGLIDLGVKNRDDRVFLVVTTPASLRTGNLRINFVMLDESSYKASVAQWEKHAFHINRWKDDTFSGFLDAPEDGYLFLPISAVSGWQFRVNDQVSVPVRILKTFYAVPVKAGPCMIDASFTPPGFRTGAAISLCTLAVLLLTAVLRNVLSKKTRTK